MPDPRLFRLKESEAQSEFYSRLKGPDRITVKAIIETIQSTAIEHASEHKFYDENTFFAVYGIAGNVTKQGERPDIDLLVVTNASWLFGYPPVSYERPDEFSGDWIAGKLRDTFSREGYKVKPIKKIPNEYSKVGVKNKGMIRLIPTDEERKPIDVVIVNRSSLINPSGGLIDSLQEFEKNFDVDKKGKPLPRVLLFST